MAVIRQIPNNFLINLEEHHEVRGRCFCEMCRRLRLERLADVGIQEAYHQFIHMMPFKEKAKLESYHASVIDQIVFGEHYKKTALEGTAYTKFKWWAKSAFPHLSRKEMDKFSCKVTEASWVFRNWDVIVTNLTNHRMTSIDARRFSVHMFYQAKSLTWCLNYNEQIRSKARKSTVEGKLYDEDSFNRLLKAVFDDGILREVEFDPTISSAIMGRLQSQVVAYCSARTKDH